MKHSKVKGIYYLNDSVIVVSGDSFVAQPKLNKEEEKFFLNKMKTL